jgi:hypothetical protein
MADNESFFRKVVRFVANPATEWTDLNARQEDSRELELEKSELKAMIERKRRNDFVRKREFDMLRRVRREGLSPEQLAALGGSSRLDDSEALAPPSAGQRPAAVKAKIDEIEQQMVGDAGFGNGRSAAASKAMATDIAVRQDGAGAADGARQPARTGAAPPAGPPAAPANTPAASVASNPPPKPFSSSRPADLPVLNLAPTAAPAPVQMSGRLPPLTPAAAPAAAPMSSAASSLADYGDFGSPFAVEVNEVVHDPELDEAVIAFANADFTQCEEALQRITQFGGTRWQHAETWLVLFDLYRATGQQQRFESLAMEYAQQFGWSAPQWYSLPKLVAEAQAEEPQRAARGLSQGDSANDHSANDHSGRDHGDIGWVSPEHLDTDAVGRLRSLSLQMPLPWVFDWQHLRRVDAEAATQLSGLFRMWSGQAVELRWLSGERLFSVLQDAAPNGVRDADPAFWLTRLDALRIANRVDQFDEAAIEYCMTYEVSPPSWEPTRCRVRISGSGQSTRTPPLSVISELSTSFMESKLPDDTIAGTVEVAHVELSGQLVGDISSTLGKLQSEMNSAPIVSVSCARLIRVDFIAAGDLLNWVLTKRSQNRAVHFVDAHRLVALFFGAMGINEHAKVQVRKV